MKNKIVKTALIIILTILFIILTIPKSQAITPGDIKGDIAGDKTIDVSFVESLEDMIRLIGIFIAVGAMMIIGIKYMTGSIEEKANYKKTMMPYLIGCIFLFGASVIAPKIIEVFKETKTAEDIGNVALGLIQTIGTFVAVAVLMILGIKYMIGSTEERASYKKSMIPYVVGAVLLFGAVNITATIANNIESSISGVGSQEQASKEANNYTSTHTDAEIQAEYARAREEYLKAVNAEKRSEKTIEYWSKYMSVLNSYLTNN